MMTNSLTGTKKHVAFVIPPSMLLNCNFIKHQDLMGDQVSGSWWPIIRPKLWQGIQTWMKIQFHFNYSGLWCRYDKWPDNSISSCCACARQGHWSVSKIGDLGTAETKHDNWTHDILLCVTLWVIQPQCCAFMLCDKPSYTRMIC
jgi:hypothetical protein